MNRANKQQAKTDWDSIVVARADTLPNGVVMLLKTSAASPVYAVQQRAQRAGIPGEVTVIQQFPLNKRTGKVLFADLLSAFHQFPYGNAKFLVKATAESIEDIYHLLSKDDPNQIVLQKSLYEVENDKQLLLLQETNKKVESLKAEAKKLESQIAELNKKRRLVVNDIDKLEREIDKLEREKESINKVFSDARSKAAELTVVYQYLFKLARAKGDAKRRNTCWERMELINRISQWVDTHCPE